ncbi:MAG: amidohydrolase [Xanthobacteraceae bacterium]|nr:amidohydrolase [Xanthobacteraceae bacterium]
MSGQNLVDVHSHFLTDDYLAALDSAGLKENVDGFPTPDWSVIGALDRMDAWGIRTAVLSISAPGIVFVPLGSKPVLARKINDQLAKFVAAHPDRFGGLAILPLPDVDAALREIEYAYGALNLDGIVLFSNIDGIYLGDTRFDPIFDELNRRDAVVFVHPVAPPGFDISRLGFPAPAIEFPFETTRMIMNMIGSGTVRRCPRVRVIAAHGGGTVPFLAPRISRNLVRFGKAAPAFTPEEVLSAFRSFYFDVTAVSHRNAINALLTLAPRDRLLYGSDYPFMQPALIPPAIDFIMSEPALQDADRQALAFGNARRLFPRIGM